MGPNYNLIPENIFEALGTSVFLDAVQQQAYSDSIEKGIESPFATHFKPEGVSENVNFIDTASNPDCSNFKNEGELKFSVNPNYKFDRSSFLINDTHNNFVRTNSVHVSKGLAKIDYQRFQNATCEPSTITVNGNPLILTEPFLFTKAFKPESTSYEYTLLEINFEILVSGEWKEACLIINPEGNLISGGYYFSSPGQLDPIEVAMAIREDVGLTKSLEQREKLERILIPQMRSEDSIATFLFPNKVNPIEVSPVKNKMVETNIDDAYGSAYIQLFNSSFLEFVKQNYPFTTATQFDSSPHATAPDSVGVYSSSSVSIKQNDKIHSLNLSVEPLGIQIDSVIFREIEKSSTSYKTTVEFSFDSNWAEEQYNKDNDDFWKEYYKGSATTEIEPEKSSYGHYNKTTLKVGSTDNYSIDVLIVNIRLPIKIPYKDGYITKYTNAELIIESYGTNNKKISWIAKPVRHGFKEYSSDITIEEIASIISTIPNNQNSPTNLVFTDGDSAAEKSFDDRVFIRSALSDFFIKGENSIDDVQLDEAVQTAFKYLQHNKRNSITSNDLMRRYNSNINTKDEPVSKADFVRIIKYCDDESITIEEFLFKVTDRNSTILDYLNSVAPIKAAE